MQPASQPQSKRLLIAGITACTLTVVIILIYLTYVSPRQKILAFSAVAGKLLPETRTRLNDVNESLQSMLDLISGKTNQSKPDNSLLLRLNVLQTLAQLKQNGQAGVVAGAETQSNSTFAPLTQVSATFSEVADVLRGRKRTQSVLGESSSDALRIAGLRHLKDLAMQGDADQEKASAKLTELEDIVMNSEYKNNAKLKEVLGSIKDNNALTRDYLIEAKKTFAYYSQITDVQIKLVPMLVSYNSLLYEYIRQPSSALYKGRLQELESTSANLQTQVAQIKIEDLPEGMADLHADNIKTINIVADNITVVEKAISQNNPMALANALDKFAADLQPYASRAVVLEMNFWQDNLMIHKHDVIVSEYKSEESDVSKIKAANKLPFN